LRPPSNISRSLGDTEFYEQVAETIFLQGKPTQARIYELEDCYRVWQYGLLSFQAGYTKNQHYSKEIIEWQKGTKFDFQS
jgi:hypothetical protein